MAGEIDLAVKSGRVRAATYEDLYGARRVGPAVEPSRAPRRKLRAAFTIFGVGIFAMALVGQRERVVRYVPATGGAYAAIGLPVNARGLTFRNVKASMVDDGPQKILAVEGHVANVRNASLNVPDLRVAVDGPDGRELYYWIAKSPKPNLTAGEEIYFRARLASPPEAGERIMVRFAESAAKQPRN